ncbi:MAG: hypothetical protein ABR978_00285 [Dehalococcoidia bacterium]|jgi:hypothetical protein
MRLLTVLLLLLVALASTRLVAGSNGAGDEGPAPTLDQVHERMMASATREGYILHNTSVIHAETDGSSYDATMEVWLDAQHDLGRRSYEIGGHNSVQIVAGDKFWDMDTDSGSYAGTEEPCFGSEHALCLILEGAAIEDESVPVTSRYQGQVVIDLPFNGELEQDAGTYDVETHFYLNVQTLLPVAMVYEEVAKGDYTPARVRVVKEFHEYEFLPADSVPSDFFDPASIGYVEPAP